MYSHGLEPLWAQEKTVVVISNLSRATWSGQERRLKLLETWRPRCGNCESTPMVCCCLLLAVTVLFWRKMACHPSASSSSMSYIIYKAVYSIKLSDQCPTKEEAMQADYLLPWSLSVQRQACFAFGHAFVKGNLNFLRPFARLTIPKRIKQV